MQVILLERVENLGQMGDTVTVKPGYARNFLLPRKKALRATQDNIAFFETQKKQIEADSLKKKKDAEAVAKKMGDDLSVVLVRQAAEVGKLYGSVSARDVAEAVTAKGTKITRQQVVLNTSIKVLGLFTARVTLHPEVTVDVTVNVARSEEEAKKQLEHGGDLSENKDAPAEAAPVIDVDAAVADVFENEDLAEQAKETLTETEEEAPAPKAKKAKKAKAEEATAETEETSEVADADTEKTEDEAAS